MKFFQGFMEKIIPSLILFMLFSTIVYSAGGWDEGGWDEGGWDFGTPAPEPAQSSASGGGRGGGGFYSPKDSNQSITYRLNLIKDQKYDFSFNGDNHKISIIGIDIIGKTAIFSFESEKMNIELKIKEPVLFNYNNDNYNDLEITLNEIYGKDVVDVTIKTIHLLITSPEVTAREIIGEFTKPIPEGLGHLENLSTSFSTIEIEPEAQEAPQKPKYKFGIGQFVGVVLLILAIVGIFYYFYLKNKRNHFER